MTRTLLVVPSAADAGLARTCLGLVRALDRRGVNVAFVKPVAQPRHDGSPDRSAALVAAISALRPPEPLSTAEVEQQLGEGGVEAVLEKTVAAWQPVYERSDVVIVEGLSPGPDWLYASELNQALARALDADVIVVGRWPAEAGRPGPDLTEGLVGDLAETLAITASRYRSGERARVVGCVIRSLPAAVPPPRRSWVRRCPGTACGCWPRCRIAPSWPGCGSATWSARWTRGFCTKGTCPGGSRTWPCSPRASPGGCAC